jgi:hypothetical protein
MEGYNKYQFSAFGKDGEQYVVRTDDKEEFKQMVADVKIVTNSLAKAPVRSNSAPTASEKPKVPYMSIGDKCHVCGQGTLEKTVKESKTGEKYNALVCDLQGCKGFAYISKFPKFAATATPIPQDDNEIPF